MRALTALLPLLLPACTWFTQQEHVLVTSEPAGARILVDGTDTGRTTPARLEIGGSFGYDHVLTLAKQGYRSERRYLTQFTEGYTSRWIDGASDELGLPPLPIFWTAGDFFFPFGVRSAIVPGEVYVKLYRQDDPLLGFDVLAARAAGARTGIGATR